MITYKLKTLIGAVAGDIIGSSYEGSGVKTSNFALFTPFSRFTDDTVLTLAVADCILNEKDFAKTIQEYGRKYPRRGYGGYFKQWLKSDNPVPYGSFGNGSGMRVSAVGAAYNTLDEVLAVAKQSAEVTHNHPEGIKGAQAIAAAVFLAKTGSSKPQIKEYISTTFDYNLNRSITDIRPSYVFDVTCQGSVPEAIIAFLDSTDYESAIRLGISLGGDSDTIACMAGAIAATFYNQIPDHILQFAHKQLPNELLLLLAQFNEKFGG